MEDILWQVGPLLQPDASISAMAIICKLDHPQMT